MASNITLTAAVRANLLSLQQTDALMSQTQTRLATGKKVAAFGIYSLVAFARTDAV